MLFGALLHATWNMLVKARPDKHVAAAVLYTSSGLLAAAALPFLPIPNAASWPYMAASTVLELLYGVVLANAYRVGDLSHAYPLMRGAAPLLVAAASSALLGERLSGRVWLGIALLSCALISLVFDGRSRRQPSSATGLALLNAFLIAAYTMVDGVGARLSGNAVAYGLWLFMLIGIPWGSVGSGGSPARWVGKDTLRHTHRPRVRRVLPGIVRRRPLGDDAGAHRLRGRGSGDIDRFRYGARRGRAARARDLDARIGGVRDRGGGLDHPQSLNGG